MLCLVKCVFLDLENGDEISGVVSRTEISVK